MRTSRSLGTHRAPRISALPDHKCGSARTAHSRGDPRCVTPSDDFRADICLGAALYGLPRLTASASARGLGLGGRYRIAWRGFSDLQRATGANEFRYVVLRPAEDTSTGEREGSLIRKATQGPPHPVDIPGMSSTGAPAAAGALVVQQLEDLGVRGIHRQQP